jgi:predicted ATP-dependent endonuclease of OLD family
MIIESLHVKNFRSILNETLYFEDLTALVGANGSGKSSFLAALNLFYNNLNRIDIEDFYNENIDEEIVIALTFKDLSKEAKEKFSSYIENEKLTVVYVLKMDNEKITGKYYGSSLQNSEFQELYAAFNIKDRSKTAKEIYAALRVKPEYCSLPTWSTIDEIKDNLHRWELANTEKCARKRDEGQFFGFKEVGQGYLGKFTKLIFIPAVRDASEDTSERRGSILTELMNLVVRSVLANKQAVIELKEETQRRYQEIMDPANLVELQTLSEKMTKTLKIFVPNSKVELTWGPLSDVNIPLPQADVKLIEDGYSSAVHRTGHGLQRAFILTIFQHLALAQAKPPNVIEPQEVPVQTEARLPDLVLVIEEPELYQHPNRQRHLAKIFLQLASGKIPGVADKTQIVYSTHSPLFVGIDRINQIRLLRKVDNETEKPKITKVVISTVDKIAEILWELDDRPVPKYSGRTLLPRLQSIMTPWMNEGFFADVIVLVEGEDDRAVIMGMAKSMDYELEGNGFSVIPCGGKANMDRPYVIFQQMGIPTYLIWDGDYGKGETEGICEKCSRPLDRKPDPKQNHRLLKLVGKNVTDWPEYIEKKFTVFKTDMETTLKSELGGELFEICLKECQSQFGFSKRQYAMKNPFLIKNLIDAAREKGYTCKTLENIIKNITSLK